MKLFIKLVLISIFNKKYINWNQVSLDLAFSLAKTNLLFHPEDKPFNKLLTNNEIKILVSDDINI